MTTNYCNCEYHLKCSCGLPNKPSVESITLESPFLDEVINILEKKLEIYRQNKNFDSYIDFIKNFFHETIFQKLNRIRDHSRILNIIEKFIYEDMVISASAVTIKDTHPLHVLEKRELLPNFFMIKNGDILERYKNCYSQSSFNMENTEDAIVIENFITKISIREYSLNFSELDNEVIKKAIESLSIMIHKGRCNIYEFHTYFSRNIIAYCDLISQMSSKYNEIKFIDSAMTIYYAEKIEKMVTTSLGYNVSFKLNIQDFIEKVELVVYTSTEPSYSVDSSVMENEIIIPAEDLHNVFKMNEKSLNIKFNFVKDGIEIITNPKFDLNLLNDYQNRVFFLNALKRNISSISHALFLASIESNIKIKKVKKLNIYKGENTKQWKMWIVNDIYNFFKMLLSSTHGFNQSQRQLYMNFFDQLQINSPLLLSVFLECVKNYNPIQFKVSSWINLYLEK